MNELDKQAEDSLFKFLHDIVKGETVYSLQGEDGFSTVQSLNFEHENGEPVRVICFWGTKQEALACQIDDWANFSLAEIQLADFVENWCVGMENDKIVAGLNFDAKMENGCEETTLELILDVVEELREQGKTIALSLHKDIDDLESQVAAVLDGDS